MNIEWTVLNSSLNDGWTRHKGIVLNLICSIQPFRTVMRAITHASRSRLQVYWKLNSILCRQINRWETPDFKHRSKWINVIKIGLVLATVLIITPLTVEVYAIGGWVLRIAGTCYMLSAPRIRRPPHLLKWAVVISLLSLLVRSLTSCYWFRKLIHILARSCIKSLINFN